jgi:hypothetical protein
MAPSIAAQSYASRIGNFSKNEAARTLLETMERKKTNLCVSVDVIKKKDLLDVVRAVSGESCWRHTANYHYSDLLHAFSSFARHTSTL